MTIDKRYSETLIGYIIRNVNQRNIPDAQFRKLKMRTVVLMQHLRLKKHKNIIGFHIYAIVLNLPILLFFMNILLHCLLFLI